MEKKIEFLGSVNGVEFTCINEYNTAIKELLDSNEPFDAQTVSHFSGWLAEEVKEDVEFLGSVNGIEFTCINEYNTAIKELLDSNEPFDAQTVSHFGGWQAEEVEEDVEEVEDGEDLTDEQVAKVFEILLDTFKKLR